MGGHYPHHQTGLDTAYTEFSLTLLLPGVSLSLDWGYNPLHQTGLDTAYTECSLTLLLPGSFSLSRLGGQSSPLFRDRYGNLNNFLASRDNRSLLMHPPPYHGVSFLYSPASCSNKNGTLSDHKNTDERNLIYKAS